MPVVRVYISHVGLKLADIRRPLCGFQRMPVLKDIEGAGQDFLIRTIVKGSWLTGLPVLRSFSVSVID